MKLDWDNKTKYSAEFKNPLPKWKIEGLAPLSKKEIENSYHYQYTKVIKRKILIKKLHKQT